MHEDECACARQQPVVAVLVERLGSLRLEHYFVFQPTLTWNEN